MKRSTTRRTHIRNGGMVLIGTGLLLIGLVTGIYLIGNRNTTNSTLASGEDSPNDGSIVPIEVNFRAPELGLTDLDGNNVSLNDYLGSVILINNWATWCPPCKAEMPALQAFYETYREEGFILIAIDAGDPHDDVKDFVNEYGLSFPVWMDPENKSLNAFKNYGLPNSYVVDRNGIVQLAWTGAINDTMLEKYVAPLIQE